MVIRSLIILLALTVSVSAQRICPPNQVNRNGLVGRWLVPGKQTGAVATPTLCLDDSNKGNHGTTVASPNYGVIFSRAAMTFNGSSQYVSVPNNSALKPSLPITISAWVNGNGNNWNVNGNIVYLSDAIHPYYCGFDLVINFTGVVEVDYGSGGTPGASSRRTLISSLTVPTSGWHHIVATITGASNMAIYIDGVSAGGSYSGSGGAMQYSSSTGGIGLGNYWSGTAYFKGSIDDVRIYNRALSASEVRAIYQGEQ